MNDKESLKKIKEVEDWLTNIHSNCDSRIVKMSIPASLPICAITNDVCEFMNCPKVKE